MKKLLLISLLILSFSNLQAQLDESQIVLYAPFDADVNGNLILDDLSVNNVSFTATLNSAATGEVIADTLDMKFGNASASFNTFSYLLNTSVVSGYSNYQSQTISAWVKFNTIAGVDQVILQPKNNGDGGYHTLRYHTGSDGINTRFDKAFNSSAPPVANTWYHVAIVADDNDFTASANGTVYLYVNGNLVSQNAPSGETNNGDYVLGARKQEDGEFFDGKIDDLLITNEVLNQTQIQNLMNNGVEHYQTEYTYSSGSWDVDPVGTYDPRAIINVVDGSTELTGSIYVNDINISTGASLSTSKVVRIFGDMNIDGNFTFLSNASSTGVLGPIYSDLSEINGEVEVEHFYTNLRAFRFVSSPVNTSTTIFDNWQEGGMSTSGYGVHITGSITGQNGLDATPSGNSSLFTLDNPSQTWQAITSTNSSSDNLEAGYPYRLYVRGDRTINVSSNSATPTVTILRAKGNLHVGDFSPSTYADEIGEYTFIGNPYQSPVDMIQLLDNSTGINQTEYFVWDATVASQGAYVTVDVSDPLNVINSHSGLGTSTANENLQIGTAAFVENTSASPIITFKERYKSLVTATNSEFSRMSSSQTPRLALGLYHQDSFNENQIYDAALLRIGTNFSDAIDDFDAGKLFNRDETLAFIQNNELLSINSRNLITSEEVIPIHLSNHKTENYVFQVNLENFSATNVFLFDNYLNQYHPINNNSTQNISFQIDENIAATTQEDRFELRFSEENLNTKDFTQSSISIYPNPVSEDRNVHISIPERISPCQYTIYSTLGKKVNSGTLAVNETQILLEGLESGVYLINLNTSKQTISKKLIVK